MPVETDWSAVKKKNPKLSKQSRRASSGDARKPSAIRRKSDVTAAVLGDTTLSRRQLRGREYRKEAAQRVDLTRVTTTLKLEELRAKTARENDLKKNVEAKKREAEANLARSALAPRVFLKKTRDAKADRARKLAEEESIFLAAAQEVPVLLSTVRPVARPPLATMTGARSRQRPSPKVSPRRRPSRAAELPASPSPPLEVLAGPSSPSSRAESGTPQSPSLAAAAVHFTHGGAQLPASLEPTSHPNPVRSTSPTLLLAAAS